MTRDVQPFSTDGIRGLHPKRRSPAQRARDLKRAARHNRAREEATRRERSDLWANAGRDEFMGARQDTQLAELSGEKRGMRREVFDARPDLEGREYRGSISLRGARQ